MREKEELQSVGSCEVQTQVTKGGEGRGLEGGGREKFRVGGGEGGERGYM